MLRLETPLIFLLSAIRNMTSLIPSAFGTSEMVGNFFHFISGFILSAFYGKKWAQTL